MFFSLATLDVALCDLLHHVYAALLVVGNPLHLAVAKHLAVCLDGNQLVAIGPNLHHDSLACALTLAIEKGLLRFALGCRLFSSCLHGRPIANLQLFDVQPSLIGPEGTNTRTRLSIGLDADVLEKSNAIIDVKTNIAKSN